MCVLEFSESARVCFYHLDGMEYLCGKVDNSSEDPGSWCLYTAAHGWQ